MPAWFYILRLRSGALYPGATKNLEERYKAHSAGRACRTTKIDPPVALLYSEEFETFSEARKREAQVKKWSRAKKEALVSGDMAKLKALAKSQQPDLIILDIEMPDVDGGEVARCLKKDAETKNIPVVFLTCLMSETETYSHGDKIMIAKSKDTSEMITVIDKVINIIT